MKEAVKNSKLSMMKVLFVLAAIVAIMATSAMSSSLPGGLGTKEADAATARKIQGTVFRSDTGQRVPYATVSLHWYKSGSGWTYWKQGQANAYGQFNFYNSPTGYHYAVRAQKTINGNTHGDFGKMFYLSPSYSTAFTSNVTIPVQSPF